MTDMWVPILRKITRIWSVVLIVLGILVFVAEIFEAPSMTLDPYPWWEILMPLSIFLAILCLGLAWRWEALGGILAIVFCAINLLLYAITGRDRFFAVLLITLPVLVPGILYVIYSWRSKIGAMTKVES